MVNGREYPSLIASIATLGLLSEVNDLLDLWIWQKYGK